MWEPKLRTPGMAVSSRLAWVTIRRSSPTDVPGAEIQCIKKSRSWKVGSSDCPSSGNVTAPATIIAPTVAYAGRGTRMMGASSRS